MRFSTRTLLAVTASLAIACALATVGLRWLTRMGVEIHQRAVAREVTEWANEYAQINDDASAIRAAEMVGYIEAYYVVGDGYRGSDESERELETARANSLRQLIEALEVYTGNRFGDDHLAWSRWAESKRRGEPSDAPASPNRAF
jgi:hypothetical protein